MGFMKFDVKPGGGGTADRLPNLYQGSVYRCASDMTENLRAATLAGDAEGQQACET